jgi:hypothetical protein
VMIDLIKLVDPQKEEEYIHLDQEKMHEVNVHHEALYQRQAKGEGEKGEGKKRG